MKKFIVCLLIIIVNVWFAYDHSHSGPPAFQIIATGTTATAGGCTPTSCSGSSCSTNDEVGNSSNEATNINMNAGGAFCYQDTIGCTGTLGTAYIRHRLSLSSTAMVAIYNDTDTEDGAPDSTDTYYASSGFYSGAITGTANDTWYADDGETLSASVTADDPVWVCIFVQTGGNTFQGYTTSSGNYYYLAASGFYESPPANLTDGSWSPQTGVGINAVIGIE